MPSGRSPAVTIAVPVHNGGRYLEESIRSALGQTGDLALTVLVLDNASTDGSAALAGRLVGEGNVSRSPLNRGAAWNFNRAVDEASGEYFAWLGADDRLRADFAEKAVAALDRSPGAPACLTGIRLIDPDGNPVGVQQDPDLASPDPQVRLRSFLRRPRWTEVYCMYRRERLLASPRFRTAFGADVLLTWWFLLRGPLVVLDDVLLDYRVYGVKSGSEQAASLGVFRSSSWPKLGLWRALWTATSEDDVDPDTRRAARRELISAQLGRHWLEHNAADGLAFAKRTIRHRERRRAGL